MGLETNHTRDSQAQGRKQTRRRNLSEISTQEQGKLTAQKTARKSQKQANHVRDNVREEEGSDNSINE